MDIRRQGYAPFGSVSSKSPKKKKNPQLIPGPGSYDVSLPLVTPIVQTIRKPNNNVIVKLGHIGTAAFLAADERFKEIKKKYSVGPGSYQSVQLDKNEATIDNKKQRAYAAIKLRQLIQSPIQRSPSITEIKKVAFDDEIEMPGKNEKTNKQRQQNIRGLNWSRMSQDRSLVKQKQFNNLGPGYYQMPQIKQRRIRVRSPSSNFDSNSVRSFFDQIICQTNQDAKARERMQRHYKSDVVGPGSYDIELKKGQKWHKYQFFGSTQQRL